MEDNNTKLSNAGIYETEIRGGYIHNLKLGVHLSRRNEVSSYLYEKQELGIDPFHKGFTHADVKEAKKLDLNSLRLCFTVSIEACGGWKTLPPVYSGLIRDKINTTDLRIREVSSTTSSSQGGEKKIIVCDKFVPSELQLIFYNEQTGWRAIVDITQENVYHRSSIVFLTPAYMEIEEETKVKMEISRIDGTASSNPINFTYLPARMYPNFDHISPVTKKTKQSEHLKNGCSFTVTNSSSVLTYTYQDVF